MTDSTLPALAMPQIKTVVVLMLENRSLDNLLGFLYANGEKPRAVYPPNSSPEYQGASTDLCNSYVNILGERSTYYVTNGTPDLGIEGDWYHMPNYDPHEPFENVRNQLYADERGKLPEVEHGDIYTLTPTMSGFAWDYDEFYTQNQAVMGSYSSVQLPVLHTLAKSYAVSDAWFASVPTQTFANRAFSLCGTSNGAVDNSEIDGKTFESTTTLFNILGKAGKSWGLYWQNQWPASGAPLFDVFTPWLLPEMKNAPNGGVYSFDDPNDPSSFMQALKAGSLPSFSYIEPKWGGGPSVILSLNGNDYHPVSDVRLAEFDLYALYNAIVQSPQWPEMLLMITFDEHGGTYDHVPPTTCQSPDGKVGKSGFNFNRLGVRVPTILISPYIEQGLVFRSPTNQDFDHTSVIATLLRWVGVNPQTAGMGNRVANAPTFDGVLSATHQQPKPQLLACDASWNVQSDHSKVLKDIFDLLGEEPLKTPMNLAEFRSALTRLPRPKKTQVT
ncbi:MAG: hypothetical protein IPK82_29735 [Polyangiaceae bacterium]|nr:hypothetical protein [Polyangiaceae bacterium]